MGNPTQHFSKTATLARALAPQDIYQWLVTKGYFPESYVLPPCFVVTKYPSYGKIYFTHTQNSFKPRITEYQEVHFPKTDFTDRTFGIIDPEIHSDIAYIIAENWPAIMDMMFDANNKVCSYSFPIPLDGSQLGTIGGLRSGRMIYEFIEMAENDVASISYRYNCIFKTDIKNFYPSVYTHAISWAMHGKALIRSGGNRFDNNNFGNRLDKLFQNANDGCTNGIPIGPAVSDLISEAILSRVDLLLSSSLTGDSTVVRFKDDYRILARSEQEGRSIVKALQAALKEYRLELNDDKTKFQGLPAGIFRGWTSPYYAANPYPKRYYDYKRFKEVYLSVVTIDRNHPGTGVIDRFLADIVTKKYQLRVKLDAESLPKIISLLLILASLRTKAFPKVLAIIESILGSPIGKSHTDEIVAHLDGFLQQLAKNEQENRYLITWICYFVCANGLGGKLTTQHNFSNPIVNSTYTSNFTAFQHCPDFDVFQDVTTAAKRITLLEHLDVFKPQ